MKIVIKTFLLVACLMFLGVTHGKTRSCDAVLRIDLNAKGAFETTSTNLEAYSAKGSCATANCARRRARSNARECGGITWQERWQTVPPDGQPQIWSQCSESGNSVYDFGMNNIKCRIYDKMCYLKGEQGRSMSSADSATIYLVTSGSTSSCGSLHLYDDNYILDECSNSERAKVCFND